MKTFMCSMTILATLLAAGRKSTWNFDDEKAGPLPTSWRITSTHPGKTTARWDIARDESAPSKPNVLRLANTNNSDSTYNLAILTGSSYKNLDLSVKVKPRTGEEDQGGGLIWRCKDENNYYICRINPLEENYRVYKVAEGKRTQFKSVKVATHADKWYTLRVVMTGPKIACYLDGKIMLEATDDTYPRAGQIGLWTKADAASSFDDLTASEITP